MARWLVKILKTLINTGESGIVYCMECWKYVGLTLTWDVLKLFYDVEGFDFPQLINFNMGCFEIMCHNRHQIAVHGLTLTWDVLKSCYGLSKRRTPYD